MRWMFVLGGALGVALFAVVLFDAVYAETEPAPMAPPQGMSEFENWDAVMQAHARDAKCIMYAVELYAPQPITDRIEAFVCPMVAPEDKVSALRKSKRELRSKTFAADDPVIVAIDERIEDLGGMD